MGGKPWTEKEYGVIVRHALMDTSNLVLNLPELSKKLGRSEGQIKKKILFLKNRGDLAKTDQTNQIDTYGRHFTEREKQSIAFMYERGDSIKEIAECFDRTINSISFLLRKLDRAKVITLNRNQPYSPEDDRFILENITFDSVGYVNNYPELQHGVKRSYKSVRDRVIYLRKHGKIKIKADRSKPSDIQRKYMNEFNQMRFAFKLAEKSSETSKGGANRLPTCVQSLHRIAKKSYLFERW